MAKPSSLSNCTMTIKKANHIAFSLAALHLVAFGAHCRHSRLLTVLRKAVARWIDASTSLVIAGVTDVSSRSGTFVVVGAGDALTSGKLCCSIPCEMAQWLPFFHTYSPH